MANKFKNLKKGDTLVINKSAKGIASEALGKKVEVIDFKSGDDTGRINVQVIGSILHGSIPRNTLRHPRGIEKITMK